MIRGVSLGLNVKNQGLLEKKKIGKLFVYQKNQKPSRKARDAAAIVALRQSRKTELFDTQDSVERKISEQETGRCCLFILCSRKQGFVHNLC